jgi:hypothetical protein
VDNTEIQATLGHKTRKSGQYRDTGNIGAQDEKEWTIQRYRQHWGTRRERVDNKEIQATLGHKTRKSGQYRDTGNIGAQDEKENKKHNKAN